MKDGNFRNKKIQAIVKSAVKLSVVFIGQYSNIPKIKGAHTVILFHDDGVFHLIKEKPTYIDKSIKTFVIKSHIQLKHLTPHESWREVEMISVEDWVELARIASFRRFH